MQTITRERRQKFEAILLEEGIYPTSKVDRDRVIEKLLVASASRSEVRGIEAAIFGDRPVTEEDMEEKTIREACNEFESALGFGQLPWDSTADWTSLRKYVVTLYQSDPKERLPATRAK